MQSCLIDHGPKIPIRIPIISPKLLRAKLRSGRLQALELQQFLHQPLEPQEPSMLVEIPWGPHKEDFTLGEKASCSLFAFAKKTLYMGPFVCAGTLYP